MGGGWGWDGTGELLDEEEGGDVVGGRHEVRHHLHRHHRLGGPGGRGGGGGGRLDSTQCVIGPSRTFVLTPPYSRRR